jgi:hypothetical protein
MISYWGYEVIKETALTLGGLVQRQHNRAVDWLFTTGWFDCCIILKLFLCLIKIKYKPNLPQGRSLPPLLERMSRGYLLSQFWSTDIGSLRWLGGGGTALYSINTDITPDVQHPCLTEAEVAGQKRHDFVIVWGDPGLRFPPFFLSLKHGPLSLPLDLAVKRANKTQQHVKT